MSSVISTVFQFSTKARNLAQLQGRLSQARLLSQEIVPVGEWRRHRQQWVARLMEEFAGGSIIARSSAPGEDSVESSMAGAFDSCGNVPADDPSAVAAAIDHVIASYSVRDGHDLDAYEILVQPMVEDVRASGVLFTRDLDKNGPYYVVNYDESGRTDAVTSGAAGGHRVVRIFKGTDPAILDPLLRAVVNLAGELEAICGSDALDIEFALDGAGRLYLLQVRPLSRTRILSFQSLDARVSAEIRGAREFVGARFARRPHLFGATTVFGEMPDWNPAEMIGTQPKPLAMSLYRHLILKSAWREARHLVGYRHPFPYHLLVEVAGRPYIDVRCSFNSFLPAGLADEVCEKLVNYYTERLRQHPEFHDKIEFDVVITCLSFDFETHAERLSACGFTAAEIAQIRQAVFQLTDNLVSDVQGVLARLEHDVAQLQRRRDASLTVRERNDALVMVVEQLLEDCIRYGTVPFSVFARCAFVATSFLRSMVHRGVWNSDDYDRYLRSIETVAGEFVADLDDCKGGILDTATFLRRYGHLRPGTYDINALTYAERPDLYLGVVTNETTVADTPARMLSVPPDFAPEVQAGIQRLLAESGFTFDIPTLNRFIVRSIQLREAVKFEFTKNLSAALGLLIDVGRYHGLSRDDLAFVPIEKFLELANRNLSADWLAEVRDLIDRNRKRYELTSAINLPDLIFSETDLQVVSLQNRRPNFITQKRVVAQGCVLTAETALDRIDQLAGRIVLIENADPGFDWLFAKGIGGLITKYGGAASHMTIRCAEFGLPAAIGCGEQIFRELAAADSILLDCAGRHVRANVV